MISCAEVREELVAHLRGETSGPVRAEIGRHLERCAACSSESAALLQTLEDVQAHVEPEVSADARMRLAAAVTEELARGRRRAGRRAVAVRAALTGAIAVGVIAAWSATAAPPTPTGPSASETAHAARVARAAGVAGAFGERAVDAASRGLAWLVASQRADGSWAPTSDAGGGSAAGATASALLAFAADGQSPHRGPRAAALLRARNRLAELVEEACVPGDGEKPIYSLAMGVRALAADYRLDHDAMSSAERRGLRRFLGDAGRRIVEWQGRDGGFGYEPRALRSDSACTLFAAAALKELSDAGVMDAGGAIERAKQYLAAMPGDGGGLAYMRPGDRPAPALTAAWLVLDARARESSQALAAVETGLTSPKADSFLAWTGFAALARHGRPLEAPVKRLLEAQRADGAWEAKGDLRESAGDVVTTAFGVLAMAEVYAR